MTNLTGSNFMIPRCPVGGLQTREYKMAGYTNFGGGSTAYTIYKYAFVMVDVDDTDGYVRDMDSGVTVTSSDIFAGIAAEQVSITSTNTADGSKKILCYVNGVWGAAKQGLAVTDIGAILYADDDNVVSATNSNNLAIGVIVDVDSTYVWFDIAPFAGRVSATT